MKRRYGIYILLFVASTWYAILLLFPSCNTNKSNNNQQLILERGDTLAHIYCASCHRFPSPALADKNTWLTGILPGMGPRLGIFENYGIKYPTSLGQPGVRRNDYPSKAIITKRQWEEIVSYYYTLAPDSLPQQHRPDSLRNGLSLFSVEMPAKTITEPLTTCLQIDPGNQLIYAADGKDNFIRVYNNRLKLVDSVKALSPVTAIDFTQSISSPGKRSGYISDIGILSPSELKRGSIQQFTETANGKIKINPVPVLDSLHRTVQVVAADLNNDGRTDLLVCDFGNLTGELYWMESLANGGWKKHIIREFPGAIKVYVDDYNHDGLPDIWALFAQGDEGIFLFTNKGGGHFEERRLLRFPPIYGSSYFELDDFNGDGYPDILYTCGDNSDYSRILKPYHGIYIFLNDGHYHFTQQYFFPIHGCYKAIARDFEHDGKLDIAAISFFADYQHQPQESFVFLKNQGNWKFTPYTLPVNNIGRWLTMDVGDVDGDGDDDIVLGNFSSAPENTAIKTDWKKGPPFILLRNDFYKKSGKK